MHGNTWIREMSYVKFHQNVQQDLKAYTLEIN